MEETASLLHAFEGGRDARSINEGQTFYSRNDKVRVALSPVLFHLGHRLAFKRGYWAGGVKVGPGSEVSAVQSARFPESAREYAK